MNFVCFKFGVTIDLIILFLFHMCLFKMYIQFFTSRSYGSCHAIFLTHRYIHRMRLTIYKVNMYYNEYSKMINRLWLMMKMNSKLMFYFFGLVIRYCYKFCSNKNQYKAYVRIYIYVEREEVPYLEKKEIIIVLIIM